MKQQLELHMEQRTGSKLGKEYVKAVYCHPAYLLICRVHHMKCQAGIRIARRNIQNAGGTRPGEETAALHTPIWLVFWSSHQAWPAHSS